MSDRNGCTCATRDPFATEHRELCPLRTRAIAKATDGRTKPTKAAVLGEAVKPPGRKHDGHRYVMGERKPEPAQTKAGRKRERQEVRRVTRAEFAADPGKVMSDTPVMVVDEQGRDHLYISRQGIRLNPRS